VIALRIGVVTEFVIHVFDIKNFHHALVIGNHVPDTAAGTGARPPKSALLPTVSIGGGRRLIQYIGLKKDM